MRISDWSSDVCSSDLLRWCRVCPPPKTQAWRNPHRMTTMIADLLQSAGHGRGNKPEPGIADWLESWHIDIWLLLLLLAVAIVGIRSEEHTSELQSLMRISYAVFCLKKKYQRETCIRE